VTTQASDFRLPGSFVPETPPPPIGTIEYQERRIAVWCRVGFDGVEYVGRLWFGPEDGSDSPLPDRAVIPGRSRDDVMAFARHLSPHELLVRHRRALAEKRRYASLRKATEEIIAKIKYMNHIAISMRAGVIDPDGAAQELDLTEHQIVDIVARLKDYAGVEG
jgi:hypothetical protein